MKGYAGGLVLRIERLYIDPLASAMMWVKLHCFGVLVSERGLEHRTENEGQRELTCDVQRFARQGYAVTRFNLRV